MAQLIRLTPEVRADLVAYLDGELDDQAAERIEAVLAQSNVARNDVEALARTYELLDSLPRYAAPDSFTEQTLATIRVSEMRPDYRQSEWYRILRGSLPVLGWMAALAAVVGVSYLTTHRWMPRESDRLLRELPVIEQLDVYSEIGGIEFLQLLDRQPGLLREMAPESSAAEGAHE